MAYHAYQSFKTGEVTPQLAHKLGVELAKRMWGDHYQVLVATHFNTCLLYTSTEDGIPYITGASNFINGKVSLVRWTPKPQVITYYGDLLITCKGTIGETAINDFGEAHICLLYTSFSGCELVHDTHRLALMNAMLHDIGGPIYLGDTLSNFGQQMKGYDVVLTNPPFGTKKGGERATRDDFTFPTSNKQLNFLQHIYRSLNTHGNARAAVVLPDNVLFADGDGERIRKDLMEKCNLHTILRLPTGIFYAQGVKTNVLFFTRGTSDKNNTKEVWIYDLRSDMPSFGKTNPLKESHFDEFVKCYNAEDLSLIHI